MSAQHASASTKTPPTTNGAGDASSHHDEDATRVSSPQEETVAAPSQSQPKAGKHWLQNDEHVIPKNNLWVVFTGLMLSVALSALDQTIVSTALPTIATDLNASAASYSWIASSYLLAATAVIPLYGRLSDLVGRKWLLLFAIFLFLLGSGLCAAAQDAGFLIAWRAVSGLGGGGIIGLVQVTTSDLVPLNRRAAFQGLFGCVWGVSSVLGPLIGGSLVNAGGLGWRWLFLINLPIGAVPVVVLTLFLKLNPQKKRSIRETAREFDAVGYSLTLAGILLFLFGFSHAETNGFNTATTISLIVVGGCVLPLPVIWAFYAEKRYPHIRPIFPPRLFRTRTTILIMFTVVLHGFAFFATTYQLPVFFQATRGTSPLLSGIYMLPYALVGSVVSAVCGPIIVRLKAWRAVYWWGWALSTLGYGLMAKIDYHSSLGYILATTGVCGLGYGTLFLTPLMGMLSAMPHKEQAATTSTTALLRNMAGSVGVTVATAIFNSRAASLTSDINGYDAPTNPSADLRGLKDLQPPSLARQVQYEYGEAVQTILIILAPLAGVGLLASLGVKGYSLQRKNVSADQANKRQGDDAAVGADGNGSGPSDNEKERIEGSAAGHKEDDGDRSETPSAHDVDDDVERQATPAKGGSSAEDPITHDIEKHAGTGVATAIAGATGPALVTPAFESETRAER